MSIGYSPPVLLEGRTVFSCATSNGIPCSRSAVISDLSASACFWIFILVFLFFFFISACGPRSRGLTIQDFAPEGDAPSRENEILSEKWISHFSRGILFFRFGDLPRTFRDKFCIRYRRSERQRFDYFEINFEKRKSSSQSLENEKGVIIVQSHQSCIRYIMYALKEK